jgi:hypothetical protein
MSYVREAGSGGHPPVLHGRAGAQPTPTEVTTDRAPASPRVLEEVMPAACHVGSSMRIILSRLITDG